MNPVLVLAGLLVFYSECGCTASMPLCLLCIACKNGDEKGLIWKCQISLLQNYSKRFHWHVQGPRKSQLLLKYRPINDMRQLELASDSCHFKLDPLVCLCTDYFGYRWDPVESVDFIGTLAVYDFPCKVVDMSLVILRGMGRPVSGNLNTHTVSGRPENFPKANGP